MMNDRARAGQAPPSPAGLCEGCAHVRIISSPKGARFYLCRLAYANPAFPRYPRIPVVSCSGFTPASDDRGPGTGG
jgi:hypothetical protein